jgi:hypothetical protein
VRIIDRFITAFNVTVLLATLSSALVAYFGAWLVGRFTRWPPARIGAFIQCFAHGTTAHRHVPVSSGHAQQSVVRAGGAGHQDPCAARHRVAAISPSTIVSTGRRYFPLKRLTHRQDGVR